MCVEVCGDVWRCVEMCGDVWRYVEMCGDVWRCVEVCGDVDLFALHHWDLQGGAGSGVGVGARSGGGGGGGLGYIVGYIVFVEVLGQHSEGSKDGTTLP